MCNYIYERGSWWAPYGSVFDSFVYSFHCTLVQRHSNSKKLVHGACTAKLFNREATSLNSFNSFNS